MDILLKTKKISTTNLFRIADLSAYKQAGALDFYYGFFRQFIEEVERAFEPIPHYGYLNELVYVSYEFWLSREQLLKFRKSNEPGGDVWYVSVESDSRSYVLFTSGNYFFRPGSYESREKQDWKYGEYPKTSKDSCVLALKLIYAAYREIKDHYAAYLQNLQSRLVAYKKREGIISRKGYMALNRKLPAEYQDRVMSWLDDETNTGLIEKCNEYLRSPVQTIETITTGRFFDACKAFYQANPDCFDAKRLRKYSNGTARESDAVSEFRAKDWYYTFADGRDDGLMKVDENSNEEYVLWTQEKGQYEFNGHHPWEIERGMSVSLDTHLYIKKTVDGYKFLLSLHPLKTISIIKGCVSMRAAGFPVEVQDSENLLRLLQREDYLAFIDENDDVIHFGGCDWADAAYGKIFDCRFLPKRNAVHFIKKAIWKPIAYNALKS